MSADFARNVTNTLAAQLATMVASVALAVVTTRMLGPTDRGQLALLLLIPSLATTFGKLGIGHAVNFYGGRIPAQALIYNSFISALLISLPLLAVTLLLVAGLRDVFFAELQWGHLLAVVVAIPAFLFSYYTVSLLQGLYRIPMRNALLFVQPASAVTLFLVLSPFLETSLWAAVIAFIASSLLVVVLGAVVLRSEMSGARRTFAPQLVRKFFHFGIRSHIGSILKDLNYRVDLLMISFFMSSSDVGYYAVAITIAEVIWKLPDAVSAVLLPKVARMNAENARTFTPLVTRMVLLPTAVICTAILLTSDKVAALVFGAEFLPSAPAIQLLLPGILMMTIWKILANDLIAQGHPGKYAITAAVGLVTLLVAGPMLIPVYGIQGAAAASSISYMTATVAIVVIYKRITNNSLKDLIVPVRSDFLVLRKFWRVH